MPSIRHLLEQHWATGEQSWGIARFPLGLAAWLYGTIRDLRPAKAALPAIHDLSLVSLGNLSVGGTGKSPLAMHLARALTNGGLLTGIVCRAYRGGSGVPRVYAPGETVSPEEAGDEPAEIRAIFPDVPLAVSSDRYAAARSLREFGVGVILLDDAHHLTHLPARRILLLDARLPVGRFPLLPLGPYREGSEGLQRADAILLAHPDAPLTAEWLAFLVTQSPDIPVWSARREMPGLRQWSLGPAGYAIGPPLPWSDVHERRAMLILGIARSEELARKIVALGGPAIAGTMLFGDHHPYRVHDVQWLESEARELGVDLLLTTGKDAVKLLAVGTTLPVFVPTLEIHPETTRPGQPSLIEVVASWCR